MPRIGNNAGPVQLDNFQLKEYVENVTSQVTGTTDDLEAYINVFEEALGETRSFKTSVETQIAELKASLNGSSEGSQLYKDAVALMTAFDKTGSMFGLLERRFDQVGNVVVGAGQQMERLHLEKRRAMDAKEILQTFMSFTEKPMESAIKLEGVIMAGGSMETRVKAAKTLRRLNVIAGQEIPGAEESVKAIHELAQSVENGLLADFHEAFGENRTEEMRVAAAILIALNGGQSCVQSFVNQHDFFLNPISAETLLTRYHPSHLANGPVVLVIGTPEVLDEALATMFGQIVETAEEDWKYLAEVFEEPWLVMDALLTRIFHEPVQVYLEAALQQAKGHSMLAYLRCLHATWLAAKTLVGSICKVYERNAGSSELQAGDLTGLVGALFSPYLEPAAYERAEMAAASELLQLAKAPLQQALKGRKNMAKSMTSFLRSSSPVKAMDCTNALHLASLFRFSRGEPLVSAEEGADGIPSPEVVKRCLMLHAEATARLFTLLPEHARPAAIEGLWSLFLQNLSKDYLEAAVDSWTATAEFGLDSKTGFELGIIKLASMASRILADMQLYFQGSLLPLAVTVSPNCYRNMVQAKTDAFHAVSTKLDALLFKEITGNLAWIKDSLLAKQKKTDFKPKADELQMLAGPSPACASVVDFLKNLSKCVLSLMDQQNSTLYLTQLGSRFHSLLIAHIRNYSISDTGALLLRNDLRAYQEVILGMGPAGQALKLSFDLIVEIGNVFLVRPENLRSLLQENLLAQLDSRLGLQFVAQRADFRSARIDLLFPEIQTNTFSAFFATTAGEL